MSPARVWRGVAAGLSSAETLANLGAIKAPTLLIWGDRDALLGRADQDALLARIPGARLPVYSDVGQAPH